MVLCLGQGHTDAQTFVAKELSVTSLPTPSSGTDVFAMNLRPHEGTKEGNTKRRHLLGPSDKMATECCCLLFVVCWCAWCAWCAWCGHRLTRSNVFGHTTTRSNWQPEPSTTNNCWPSRAPKNSPESRDSRFQWTESEHTAFLRSKPNQHPPPAVI